MKDTNIIPFGSNKGKRLEKLRKQISEIFVSLLLGIIYYVLITPIGFVRRLSGKNRLQLNRYKKNKDSVFVKRNHRFVAEDFFSVY